MIALRQRLLASAPVLRFKSESMEYRVGDNSPTRSLKRVRPLGAVQAKWSAMRKLRSDDLLPTKEFRNSLEQAR
jgi:hypothetical protein